MEKDIRTQMKGVTDVKQAELIGVRSSVIADYTVHFPNEKATANAGNKADWAKYTKEMTDLSKQLTDEAAKGDKADKGKLAGVLKRLDANCTNCHNKFRDD